MHEAGRSNAIATNMTNGTSSPTFRYMMGQSPCELVPIWCPNDVYFGGTDRGHVAGWDCIADHECANGMAMLPDWGGACAARTSQKQEAE